MKNKNTNKKEEERRNRREREWKDKEKRKEKYNDKKIKRRGSIRGRSNTKKRWKRKKTG